MKKFLIAGSSLAAVAAAGSAGAVDVTLGGSIDMGVEFGVGKNYPSDLAFGAAYNNISLSLAAAGTTDGGMKYGGSFTLATATELEFNAYDTNGTAAGGKMLVKGTVSGATDIEAAVYNVSGGQSIAAANIVGVKINSAWNSVGATVTGHHLPLTGITAADLCKVAGMGTGTFSTYRLPANGVAVDTDSAVSGVQVAANPHAAATGYLPAGQVVLAATATPIALTNGQAVAITTNTGNASARGSVASFGTVVVTNAAIYAGPFMEVKLQSSSTKMVVGAVCVEGLVSSTANFFLNNASKVVTASDASIYIEGGFGKLTLQTGDYSGAVSAVAGAGDVADIDAEGLVVIAEGVGLLGANPYVAVDLNEGDALGANLEILTGGTIDMGGMSAAVDVALGSGSDPLAINGWDLGLDYSLGDMSVSFAADSSNAWGMSASMAVAGFAVDATFGSDGNTDHEKSGISYSVAASTSLNGFGLSLGVDQDMQPTVGLSKSMGGLSLYAGYDAADEGGKVGATLSF